MVIQVANIVAGFVLAAPKLKEFGARANIEKAEAHLSGFRGVIGIIELVLGGAALIDILTVVPWMYLGLGLGIVQPILAIVMGLILASHLFDRWPAMQGPIGTLRNNAEWIGIAGIVVGLLSIF